MCLSEGVRKNILCVTDVCEVVWEQVQAAGLRIGCRQVVLWLGLVILIKVKLRGFPGGAVVENLPANAEDTGSSPGLGRSHMPRSN